jgi:hypothetical protein
MGIVAINELAADRSAAFSISGGRTHSVTLDVETDDQTMAPAAIIMELGLYPSMPYRFPLTTASTFQDLGSFLQSVKVDTVESGFEHRVTLEFSPYDASIDGAAQGPQVDNWIMAPFLAPPTVRWSSASEDFYVTHDRDGKPILNKAGDPFEPAIQIPISTPVANITRVLKSFDPGWISYFKDSVNDAEWLGQTAESVLCQEITADKFYDADWGHLWTVNYQFAFRPSVVSDDGLDTLIQPGWAVQVLNAGLRQRKLVDAEHLVYAKRQIKIEGAPVNSPEKLDAEGAYDPNGEPIFLTFNVRRKVDFSLLNLPLDLFSASTP